MHAGIHSLAHRAPSGATRTRVRWQPYSAATTSSSSMPSRSPPTAYLNTPLSVSPYSTPATSFDSDRKSAQPPPIPAPKDSSSKHTKYAIGLVDQAVKSLCEIWHNQDIPPVFQTTLALTGTPAKSELVANVYPQISARNTQLPSPLSPTTQPSPISLSEPEPNGMFGSRTNLVPIKGFVHEVLRRSRTSGCVLQTALCYLEAIRSKIPELAEQERSGLGFHPEPELAERIIPATSAEIEQDVELSRLSLNEDAEADTIDTVKVTDVGDATIVVESDLLKKLKAPSEPLTPLPPLPSPLLCPRRAFLAALILASKFTQDKCYSNRAWAKLSGLPPREIGRCERALGDALDWRLWVGKTPAAPPTPNPSGASKPLVRCQSESDLKAPARKAAFLVQDEPSNVIPTGNGLKRNSTLPADAFSSRQESSSIPARNLDSDYAMTVEMPSLSMIPSASTKGFTDMDTCECPPTELIDPYPTASFSPCPSLSYSPSSTDSSSSGDRTIQMSSFVDDMPPLNGSAIALSNSESWPWLESPPSIRPFVKVLPPSASIFGFTSGKHPPLAAATLASGLPEIHILGYGPGQDYPRFGSLGATLWNGEPPPWSTVR